MIELRDLTFRYTQSGFGFRIPELVIPDRSRIALAGPSGCGKTTLLHLLAGILAPESGVVRTDSVEVSSLGDAARRAYRINSVGMVFQAFELLDYLNVEENILLPFSLNSQLRIDTSRRESMLRLAESLGLTRHLQQRIDRLSQGERQRIAICRSLVTNPSLLLADEPTGNVDPAQSREVLELLFHHVAACNATLVMTTHDHSLLDAFDRVIDFSQPDACGIRPMTESAA